MLYHCYLDDSKDEKQEKLVVSAGFFGNNVDWESLQAAWNKQLMASCIEYFKTSEYRMLTGEFAQFRVDGMDAARQKANDIKANLQDIVRRHPGIRGMAVSVPLATYRNVYKRPEAKGTIPLNPYHSALMSVVFETAKRVRSKSGENIVAFVHDKSDDFPQLRSTFEKFKGLNPDIAPCIGGLVPLDDKKVPQLQMADMIANHMLGVESDRMGRGGKKSNVTEMANNIELLGFWSEDYLLSVLKNNLSRKGRPIPIDLQSEEYG